MTGRDRAAIWALILVLLADIAACLLWDRSMRRMAEQDKADRDRDRFERETIT